MTTRPPVSLPKSIGRRPAAGEHARLSVTRSDSPDARLDSAPPSRDAYWGSLSLAAGLGAVQRERGVICQPSFLPASQERGERSGLASTSIHCPTQSSTHCLPSSPSTLLARGHWLLHALRLIDPAVPPARNLPPAPAPPAASLQLAAPTSSNLAGALTTTTSA